MSSHFRSTFKKLYHFNCCHCLINIYPSFILPCPTHAPYRNKKFNRDKRNDCYDRQKSLDHTHHHHLFFSPPPLFKRSWNQSVCQLNLLIEHFTQLRAY
ncbi:hypothetical protein DERF_009165 [Dermatophagoides farinae]|uniref:Uncharacterized protein n=1 Tax=Dermatophagoides farinae TaxID=6954 RepID=A0A922HVU8_DERFA|nr:hypothetical protein DERF_009165 [Dermatophagoides farinae]